MDSSWDTISLAEYNDQPQVIGCNEGRIEKHTIADSFGFAVWWIYIARLGRPGMGIDSCRFCNSVCLHRHVGQRMQVQEYNHRKIDVVGICRIHNVTWTWIDSL